MMALRTPAEASAAKVSWSELEALAADREGAVLLAALRARMCGELDRLVSELAGAFNDTAGDAPTVPLASGAGVLQLGAASRQRERQAREGRELAQALVLGALQNQGNPGWDPALPDTDVMQGGGVMAGLLSLGTH